MTVVLYDYWRSSASYRVRIALNLKGISHQIAPVNLLDQEHRSERYLALNPQGLLPSLKIDDQLLTQSLAIIEYLDETNPDPPLLPSDPIGRARARALAYAIAMDIHPICNLNVVAHLDALTQGGAEGKRAWMQHFISRGLSAFETMLTTHRPAQRFCAGDQPSLADICLVPQVYNAERWGVGLEQWPVITKIVANCGELEAFRRAVPAA